MILSIDVKLVECGSLGKFHFRDCFSQKTFYRIPEGQTSWNVRFCVLLHCVDKGYARKHAYVKVKAQEMYWLENKRGILSNREERAWKTIRLPGWGRWGNLALGWVWDCIKAFLPFPSLTCNHTGTWLRAFWGPGKFVFLKVVIWFHPIFRTIPPPLPLLIVFTFLLLWGPAEFQIILTGDRKQDKIRGGSSVLNQKDLKGWKIGLAATRERIWKS